jgi:OCT family organic cation transporter-like MFS transporter 4/5
MRTVELVMGLSMTPLLLYHFLIPESSRWLISKGRMEEAKEVLTRGLKINKLPLSRLEKLNHLRDMEPPKNGYVSDLFKYSGVRRNLICMCFCMFAVGLGSVGLSFNTPTFNWNVYLVYAVPAFLAIPLSIVLPFFENTAGRKSLLTFMLLFTGLALLCTMAVPIGKFTHNWPVLVFAWVANVTVNLSWTGAVLFTKDLFPTTHRTMAFGLVQAFARMGSFLGPFIVMLDYYDPILSLLFYSFWLLLGGIGSLWIWPETKNSKFPDSLEECEELASTKNTWLCCLG